MDLGFLTDYVNLIALGICLCIGFVIKNLIPTEKINKYIPLILSLLGLLIVVWANNWVLTPAILLSGLFSGLASTGLYETFRNLIEKKGEK